MVRICILDKHFIPINVYIYQDCFIEQESKIMMKELSRAKKMIHPNSRKSAAIAKKSKK